MYTWEIRKYLRDRNYVVNREEFLKIVNQVDNPQIVDVRKAKNVFEMITSDDDEKIVFTVK